MLHFNNDKFEYWEVYESIKRYYPIGVKRVKNGLYDSYPGIKELETLIADNVHDERHFQDRWELFTKELAAEIHKEIIGTTYPHAPSFSSFVLLDETSLNNLTRAKQIYFPALLCFSA